MSENGWDEADHDRCDPMNKVTKNYGIERVRILISLGDFDIWEITNPEKLWIEYAGGEGMETSKGFLLSRLRNALEDYWEENF